MKRPFLVCFEQYWNIINGRYTRSAPAVGTVQKSQSYSAPGTSETSEALLIYECNGILPISIDRPVLYE